MSWFKIPTVILRPNGTEVNQWRWGDHTNIDDDVEDPEEGDGQTIMADEANGDDLDIITISFPNTIDDVDEVTNIRVKTDGWYLGTRPDVDVDMGGSQGYEQVPLPGILEDWADNDFPGSFSQADLDGLEVTYKAHCPDKGNYNQLEVCYVIVTYTVLVVGYGHDFLGIPAANIASIMGIPTANIDNICGL